MLPIREGVRMGLADPCERRVETECHLWRMGLGVLVILWGLVPGTYLLWGTIIGAIHRQFRSKSSRNLG